jgi:hypothetical protein
LTAVDYPPMQDPTSFNLDAVNKKVEEMIKTTRVSKEFAERRRERM